MTGQRATVTSKSEATKAAILAAARERFAADGYERSTIRAIAGDARVDPALVMRYFASKEKLFAAAADFDLHLPDLSALPRTRLGKALVSHFLDRWEGDDNLKALMRASMTNDAAAQRLRRVFSGQLLPFITSLCADRESASMRAGLVVSQAMGLALTRYVLRIPPVVAMRREEIVAWLGPTMQRYITG
ncbi:MAG TPA: TetR family transcriptional regulator [Luteimonas sp.]|nr:TetR family transcriptional regulator [Luteimonas sp.]